MKSENKDQEINVIQGVAEKLPFPERYFSCVYSCEAAFHFYDKRTFIKETHRVLKEKGTLVIGDITKKSSAPQNKIMEDYRNMLNAEEFFTREKYLDMINDTFDRRPNIDDITDKNIKYLTHGSKLLLNIFEYIEKFPLLKIKMEEHLKKRGIDLPTFLENIRTTKLSYGSSMVEYLKIHCVK
ncbi:MAG: class I SAM-dependent methyltransferase [Candidatus Natronoplasma sp.]